MKIPKYPSSKLGSNINVDSQDKLNADYKL